MLADLDDRLADSQLGVTDAARRSRVAYEFELRRKEHLAVEVDRRIGVADDEVRPYGSEVDAFEFGLRAFGYPRLRAVGRRSLA